MTAPSAAVDPLLPFYIGATYAPPFEEDEAWDLQASRSCITKKSNPTRYGTHRPVATPVEKFPFHPHDNRRCNNCHCNNRNHDNHRCKPNRPAAAAIATATPPNPQPPSSSPPPRRRNHSRICTAPGRDFLPPAAADANGNKPLPPTAPTNLPPNTPSKETFHPDGCSATKAC